MKIYYNRKLKELARKLRNNSTPAEIILWKQLRNGNVMGYDFHRQKPIGNFIADFYCHALRLVIEVDGSSHDEEAVQEKDRKKEEHFQKIGLVVMRFTNQEVLRDMDHVMRTLEAYIGEFREKHLPGPPC